MRLLVEELHADVNRLPAAVDRPTATPPDLASPNTPAAPGPKGAASAVSPASTTPLWTNGPNAQGASPWGAAATGGQRAAVAFLLEHGAAINQPAPSGATALFAGCLGGHVDIVQLLIEVRGGNGLDYRCQLATISALGTSAHSRMGRGWTKASVRARHP